LSTAISTGLKEGRFVIALLSVGDFKSPLLDASQDLERGLAFPENEFVFAQIRLLRIFANVADAIGKMFLIANQSIEVIALPEVSRALKELVDLPRREALPTLD
jgi:hypothetical protein